MPKHDLEPETKRRIGIEVKRMRWSPPQTCRSDETSYTENTKRQRQHDQYPPPSGYHIAIQLYSQAATTAASL